MRLIGTVDNQNQAEKVSAYLKNRGIENTVEGGFEPSTGLFSYSIWGHNEDQLALAAQLFEEGKNAPLEIPVEAPPEEEGPGPEIIIEEPNRHPRATFFLLALCAFIFFLNLIQAMSFRKEGIGEMLITPVQVALLYDVPPILEDFEKIVEKYHLAPTQKYEELPQEVKDEIKVLEQTPFWRGLYDLVLLKLKGEDASVAEGALFIKLRQGQIWRLFSPCVLHTDLLHILFNMLWLWVLGRQVEQRIGLFRYVLLSLLIGIFSNAVQYFMSGPFFLGYSGIVTGLAGFIWMRERIAPWEGYPLQRSVIIFLALFVGAMFVLQFSSFLLVLFTSVNFSPNIANSAHIGGALIGALLARLTYFEARST